MATLPELLQQAHAHHRAGAWNQAEAAYREVLSHAPQSAEVRRDLAWLLVQKGDRPAGIDEIRRAIECAPVQAALFDDLGIMLNGADRFEQAVLSFQEAIRQDPTLWQSRFNLGNTLQKLGRYQQAVESYQQALQFAPNDPDVHLNLGVAQRELGNLPLARDSFQRVLQLRPQQAEAWINLGRIERAEGQIEQAITCYRRAIDINPHSAVAHNNLGSAWRAANDLPAAIASFEQALRINPSYSTAYANLGEVMESLGRVDEAIGYYHQALRIKDNDALKIKCALALPVILESHAQIEAVRLRLAQDLDQLSRVMLHVADPITSLGSRAFPLAYQGKNERAFQSQIAALIRRATPSLAYVAAHCQGTSASLSPRIKIGFLSAHFKRHTIGKLNAGLIQQLDRRRFEVVVFRFAGPVDEMGALINNAADGRVTLAGELELARAQVEEQRLDVLFYTDIGMDPMTCYLAHSRLSGVQCVTWGHPLTTGIPTLDYFISSDDLERPGAESDYTETLVRLPWLANYYFRPQPSTSLKTRAEFGLRAEDHVYGCLQSIFKLHPDDDALWAGILRGDPAGILLLLEGTHAGLTDLMRARLTRSIPDVVDRIRFVPQQTSDDYARLLSLIDVLLDPLHFGGGETSYQSFAVGTPIVTLPGEFLRSRITYALYRTMGITDAIATSDKDFVARAVRLGTDRHVRDDLRDRILAANHRIYENIAAVPRSSSF